MLARGDCSDDHLPPKFLQTKQDDKFCSKLSSKNRKFSKSELEVSFRASGAVPFTWEACPGTPKHTYQETPLPPLTPPPSYLFTSNTTATQRPRENLKPRPFRSIFPLIACKTPNRESPSHSSSSMSSSSISSCSIPLTWRNPHVSGRNGVVRSSTSGVHFEQSEEMSVIFPACAQCFGSGDNGAGGRFKPMKRVKKALSFITARGTA